MRAVSGLMLIAVVVVTASAAAAQGASFQGLGDLPGGAFSSGALGLSSDGNTVVGVSVSTNGSEAFRWTEAGGMSGLGDLAGGTFTSIATDVSDDGSVVVGGGNSANGPEAFRWTAAGGIVGLGDLPGSAFNSRANGVSGDGAVVVGYGQSNDGVLQAFRWTAAGGMTGLGFLPGGSFSEARGVASAGAVITGVSEGGFNPRAFRWTAAGGMVDLGVLPGSGSASAANAVSADGSVVVGVSNSGPNFLNQAFRWTQAAGMEGLGFLSGSSFSQARAVSADGTVVVGEASGGRVFIWTAAEGIRDLREILVAQGVDMTGWTLTAANAISANGRVVVGVGTNPQGQQEAFRAMLEPSGHRWIDPTGGSWDVASNWEPATVPGPGDRVRFDIPGTYTVFSGPASGPRTVLGLHAQDGTIDYELDNLNLISVSLTDPSLAVSADATAKVISGSTTIVDGIIGFEDNPAGDSTTTARLQVFNAGTTLVASSLLLIGGGTGLARGDLFVAAGELQSATAAVGAASVGTAVVGNGGEWTVAAGLTVGLLAQGTVAVEEGGRILADAVTLNAATDDPTVFGSVSVSGFGAGRRSELLVFDTLAVGASGSAELQVLDGGLVTADHLAVGRAGQVFVSGLGTGTGFGSELVADAIVVQNLLSVFESALVQANTLTVGGAGLNALAVVGGGQMGPGSLFVQGACSITGNAATDQSNLFIFETGEALCLSASVGDGAQINIVSPLAQLTVRGVLNLVNGALAMDSGTLDAVDLDGEPTADPVDVAVFPDAAITGIGFIFGTVVAGGEVGPGIVIFDPLVDAGGERGGTGGSLVIRGRVVLEPTATLTVPLAGPDSTQQGRLRVRPVTGHTGLDGSATLSGTLRLAFQDGYAPQAGDTFLLLDAASTTGSFDTTDFTGLEPGWQFEIQVTGGAVVLRSLSDGVPTTPAEPGAPRPASLVLHPPAPNPTEGETRLRYDLPAAGHARLAIYDALGREVAELVDAERPRGVHEAVLHAGRLAPGTYIARLQAAGAEASRVVTVVR